MTEFDGAATSPPPAEEPGVPVTSGDVTPPDEETLQEQIEEKKAPTRKLYGTFAGVFTPTLLTILGVIMYLREGLVVGNAGLLGAWLIILISFIITTTTGLSLSSITTNIRIGAGGAFSIISQSLGLWRWEAASESPSTLPRPWPWSCTSSVFGRAGVLSSRTYPAILVDFGVFAVLFIIAYISAGLAFRVQYLIMLVIGSSLASVAYAAYSGSMTEPITWWGTFPGSIETGFSGITFWGVFAVYFLAATGIMAGLNMSGELKDPRRSIPLGTMSAIAVSLVIYIGLAYWLARAATPDELVRNYTIMIERSAYGPLVLGGLLGATFSSALASIVGAPRILQALGEHNILLRSEWFSKRSNSGEPRNAMIFTGPSSSSP